MAFPTEQQLTDAIWPVTRELDVFVEKITLGSEDGKPVVQVYLDKEGGLDSEATHQATGAISEVLDAAEAAGTFAFPAKGYLLQVGSLGANAPLTKPRHWRNNRGRLVAARVATLFGGEKQLYRIGAVSDDETQVNLIGHEGKKLKVFVVNLADIAKAKVEIEFNTPPAAETELSAQDFQPSEN